MVADPFHIYQGKRVLVTGAGGFIGSHLIATLQKIGADTTALVRDKTDLWRLKALQASPKLLIADLRDYEKIRKYLQELKPHHVFHLAVCRDEVDWQKTLDINISGSLNLLNSAARSHLKRFVHLGSSLEYGKPNNTINSSQELQPDSLYGSSKACASLLLRQASRSQNLPLVILRTFYVYGPLESDKKLIPMAIKAGQTQHPLALTREGAGRDFIFINDVVRACLLAGIAQTLDIETFNIASGKQFSNEEIVRKIGKILGQSVPISKSEHPSRPWDHTKWHVDIADAHEQLGWKPHFDLDEGLKLSIDGATQRNLETTS